MMKKYYLWAVLTVLTALVTSISFGYFRIAEKEINEFYLPLKLSEESQTWKTDIGIPCIHLHIKDEAARLTYLLKSLSGVYPITIKREGDGVSVQSLAPQNLHSNDEDVFILKARASFGPVSSKNIMTSKGEEIACPRFPFFIELYLVDKLIIPVKVNYGCTFQYDPEKKEFFIE